LLVSFFYFHSFYFFLFFFFGLCHLHDHILCKWPRDLRGIYVGIYNIRIRWPAALSGVGNKFLIRIALITTILSADTAESPRAAHSQIQRYMALPYWKNKKRKNGRYERGSDAILSIWCLEQKLRGKLIKVTQSVGATHTLQILQDRSITHISFNADADGRCLGTFSFLLSFIPWLGHPIRV